MFQPLRRHQSGCHGKRTMGPHQSFLHPTPKGTVFPDTLQELLHQFIPFVFEQFVPPHCCFFNRFLSRVNSIRVAFTVTDGIFSASLRLPGKIFVDVFLLDPFQLRFRQDRQQIPPNRQKSPEWIDSPQSLDRRISFQIPRQIGHTADLWATRPPP